MLLNNLRALLPLPENPLGNYLGVTSTKREIPIVVSFSSNKESLDKLPKTIYSLLNQKLKPDKVIFWIDKDYENKLNLPYDITQFVKNGLEIKFVKDINSHTKYYYALREFPNSVIVTATEGVYYDPNWLNEFYLSYITHPNDIHVAQTFEVVKCHDSLSLQNIHENVNEAKFSNFIINKHGALYPPKCFSAEVFRKDIFLKNTLVSDEAWLWVMALLSNRKIRVVKNLSDKYAIKLSNSNSIDESLKYLLNFYKNNVFDRLK